MPYPNEGVTRHSGGGPAWLRHLVVNYSELVPLEGEGESWNDIITTGVKYPLFKGADPERAKGATITEADLDQMIANFERFVAMEGPPRVDTQHATARWETGDATKLRAEIVQLRKVQRDGLVVLQGLFRWTVRGKREVGDRDWRGFSAELADPGLVVDKDTNEPFEGMVLTGGTLTNDPYWSGMQPIALTEILQAQGDGCGMGPLADIPLAINEEGPGMDLKLMSEKLGTPVHSEDHLVQLFADLQAKAEVADKVPGLEEKVAQLTTEREAAAGESQLLSERLGKMEAELAKEREERTMANDFDREAVAKAEIGTYDEPGIARRIYRKDATLYAEAYGKRPDGYITGRGGEGHNVEDPQARKPAGNEAPDTTSITTPQAATEWLSEQAAAWLEAKEQQYTTAGVKAFAKTLGNEGNRLFGLMMEA